MTNMKFFVEHSTFTYTAKKAMKDAKLANRLNKALRKIQEIQHVFLEPFAIYSIRQTRYRVRL